MHAEARDPRELGIDLAALAGLLRAAGPLAVLDLETSGLPSDPGAEILFVGALLLGPDARSAVEIAAPVRPRRPVPRAARRASGLADAALAGAPPIEELAKPLEAALAGRVVVAHAADFERHFLSREVSPELDRLSYLDTQDLFAVTHPDAPDLRLPTLIRLVLGAAPSALAGARDTARLLSVAAAGAARGEARYAAARAALETYAAASPWLPLLAGGDVPALAGPVALPDLGVPIPPSDEPPVPFHEDAITSVLADEARGRRWFPGYRVRPQQIELARHFARTLADGGTLLAEGGTGVGKSLAYLAAAIPFAAERAAAGERGPVVISTRTKLLQDQLLEKDIPAAAAMLGYPETRALSIKGRANYACARRLAHVLAEGREPRLLEDDRSAYAVLAACARTRRYGEIGALPAALLARYPPLRDLLRRAVAARAEHCTREQCASERGCPLGRRRAALARAHVVVANHDLLLRWPPDYPTFAHAIVDEAQELASVADEAYALEVRPADLLERYDELFGSPSPPRKRAGATGPPGGRVQDPLARERRRALREDLVALGRSLADRSSEYGEVQLPVAADASFPDAAQLARHAAARLDETAREADARAEVESDEDGPPLSVVRASAELAAAGAALRAAFAAEDAGAVAAFEGLAPPYDQWRLAVRAVSPAGAFREQLHSRLDALACVSATLFVGGDPFAALGELEVGVRSEEPSTRVCVDSPFPYAEHMRVVVLEEAEDLVDDTAAVVTDLARLLSGRTLGLFTSLRRMREVASRVTSALRPDGLEVIVPRRATDDPSALVARFAERGGGRVLLGARTFWQGLDVPGEALQAVVIEKLPFEVPSELRKRREARLRAQGVNAFARYSTGKMLLHLKQMIGRLIRSEDDRGVVVIVDGRRDRFYFRRLAEALPPGCGLTVARREALPGILAEVGLGRATTVGCEEAT